METQKGTVCGECFYHCMQDFQMRVQKLVDRYEAQYQKKRDRKVCYFTATAAQWHTADMLSSLSFTSCNVQYLRVFCCAIYAVMGFDAIQHWQRSYKVLSSNFCAVHSCLCCIKHLAKYRYLMPIAVSPSRTSCTFTHAGKPQPRFKLRANTIVDAVNMI